MSEAIFNKDPILSVSAETIDDLKDRALKSPYLRFRLCMHFDTDALTQEMIIVSHRDSYMPPHRHPPGKSESYHVIEGGMIVYFFDDDGNVTRKLEMGEYGKGLPSIYRLSEPTWHMPIPTSDWLVYHETYSGPFSRDADVQSPKWLPDEEAISSFLLRVRNS